MKKILFGLLGIIGMFITPGFAEENYLSNLAILGTYTAGAAKPYKIPVRVSNGETKQIGYVYTSAPLYKLYDVADTIDFQTGQVTHYIKKDIFNGTEEWGYSSYGAGKLFILDNKAKKGSILGASNFYPVNSFAFGTGTNASMPDKSISIDGYSLQTDGIFLNDKSYTSLSAWKAHLTELYNAGTPLEVYVEANTPTTEQIDLSTLPQMSGTVTYQIAWPEIKVATTKYVESEFAPMVSALQSAISVVDSVVSRTITQAASIATLQSGKQTRPDETCPAGKKCLLVEGTDGQPHWYEICSGAHCLPDGYTELGYIESTGTQYIDTGIIAKSGVSSEIKLLIKNTVSSGCALGVTSGTGQFHPTFWYNNRWDSVIGGDEITSVVRYNTPLVATFESDARGYKFYVDGVLTNSGTVTYSSDLSLNLFRRNTSSSGSSNWPMYGNMYYAKIWENDTLVRDFVPVKRNSDGVLGMYDLVGGRFYGNAGTGEFTAGPVAE